MAVRKISDEALKNLEERAYAASVNLGLAEEIAKRGIEKTGSTQDSKDVASVIEACADLGLLKIKDNQ